MDEMLRKPQVYAGTYQEGQAATIVNWREISHGEFSFRLGELGIVLKGKEECEVKDMWTGTTVKVFKVGDPDIFKVDSIPGHGQHTLWFDVYDPIGTDLIIN
jgi:hypothetical protein